MKMATSKFPRVSKSVFVWLVVVQPPVHQKQTNPKCFRPQTTAEVAIKTVGRNPN